MSSRCETCMHWRPVEPTVSDDGECSRIGVIFYTESRHVVLDGNILPGKHDPTCPTLITPKSFGCARHEPR